MPQKKLSFLYLLFVFIIVISCQKKEKNTDLQENKKLQIEKLLVIADRFYDNKKLDTSFYYYNKIHLLCNPVQDADISVKALNRMANIQQTHEDYIGSKSTLTEALPYLKHIKNPNISWNTYNLLGNGYVKTADYTTALTYFNKALTLKTSESKKEFIKKNIGFVYMKEGKHFEAIGIFEHYLENNDVSTNPKDYAQVLNDLGFCYFQIKDPEAISYLKKALKIRSEINDNLGLGFTYYNLALYYLKNDQALAKKYMLLSNQNFINTKSLINSMDALKLLIDNSNGSDLKKHSIQYVETVERISEIRNRSKNKLAKIKYDSKKEKNENLILKTYKARNELQIEKQKTINIISYVVIVLSLSLILTLYFYLTSKGKKVKIEATYFSETRISKKLHDELANDIYHTMAFAEHKNLSIVENKEQLLQNLDDIYSRTRDISKENSPLITDENFIFHLEEMIEGFSTPKISIITTAAASINWNQFEKIKKTTVYRVLQELLVNMKKHSNATLVTIVFEKTEKSIMINYSDNGKGTDVNTITFKNGLHNVENRLLAIKGTIDIATAPDQGFQIFIKFPIS
ncbi:tetratricopeptide repeat-containing sensor histidine kinase [Flavobacterium hercynium]|uniref:histidine kinase n=1 Tax=Flavobacterium hercynium TaxID=387094 RepID=A0A226HQ63_9FLAO|nr:tetratricopeptide repeat-containing sensor histidine kinase [Flavobacterium hercynium]OXA95610.1 ATP-binding protein [Flavobacterium hercynium]